MICMKSSTGVMILFTRSLRPAHSPSGSPIRKQKKIAASTCEKVAMASDHSPWKTKNKKIPAVSAATLTLPIANATKVTSTVVPNQPISGIPRPVVVW